MFCHLVGAAFPRLAAHLEGLGAHVAGVSSQWFLCLFVNSLPLESALRVWDLFFFQGCASVLFRVALALVDAAAQAQLFLPVLRAQLAVAMLHAGMLSGLITTRAAFAGKVPYGGRDKHHLSNRLRRWTNPVMVCMGVIVQPIGMPAPLPTAFCAHRRCWARRTAWRRTGCCRPWRRAHTTAAACSTLPPSPTRTWMAPPLPRCARALRTLSAPSSRRAAFLPAVRTFSSARRVRLLLLRQRCNHHQRASDGQRSV